LFFIFGVDFKSMYDEPRRAAVTQAMKNLSTNKDRPKTKNNRKLKSIDRQQPPAKRARKPKLIEKISSSSSSSSSTSSSSSENESEREQEDKEAGNNRIISKNSQIADIIEDTRKTTVTAKHKRENIEEATSTSTAEDIISNLIMLEHNYFEPFPTAVHAARDVHEHSRPLEQTVSQQILDNDKTNERKAVKRRSTTDLPEKGELKYKFKMRTKEEEERIIWSVYDDVIDIEDLSCMKEAFESLQQVTSKEIESFNWDDLSCILLLLFLFVYLAVLFSSF